MALYVVFLAVLLIQAHAQPGFISIDCGAPAGVNYNEPSGINYFSDANLINTGVSMPIESGFKIENHRHMLTVRSFPDGKRNCYKISVTRGSKYLIRTTFLYGNYDGRNMLPQFDLLLGPNLWDTVTIRNAYSDQSREIIHVPSLDFVQICLVNTGNGTPFITAIEFRTLKNNAYVTQFGSLKLHNYMRFDLGSNRSYSYPDDVYDRFWYTYFNKDWTQLSASTPHDILDQSDYQPGAIIMSTAVTPANGSAPLVISWEADDEAEQFYVYMHFLEIQALTRNQTRKFNIMINGDFWVRNYSPPHLQVETLYSTSASRGKEIKISLERTENSTLPPIISAIEIYRVIDLQKPETFQGDGTFRYLNTSAQYNQTENPSAQYNQTENPSDQYNQTENPSAQYNQTENPSAQYNQTEKKNIVTPIASSISVVVVLKIAVIIWWILRRKKSKAPVSVMVPDKDDL